MRARAIANAEVLRDLVVGDDDEDQTAEIEWTNDAHRLSVARIRFDLTGFAGDPDRGSARGTR
jgi:hypothetical protein